MRMIVHRQYGEPADVLALVDRPMPKTLGDQSILVEVRYAPVHPGDLLGVSGSPAFSTIPMPISDAGRTPGLEGMGIIEAIGSQVAREDGIQIGRRVAFFPAPGSWKDVVELPRPAVVPLPTFIPDTLAANLLIDVITASIVIRSGAPIKRDVLVLQTAAGSAVGRYITLLLNEQGVRPIRLVRSERGAGQLRKRLPGSPVISTDNVDWKKQVNNAIGGQHLDLVFDAVGGGLLPQICTLLNEGGQIVNYGSLGGATTDIRLFVPRRLSLLGVSIAQWFGESEKQRNADIATALRLAEFTPEQFDTPTIFMLEDFAAAARAVWQPGKRGGVLLDFRNSKNQGKKS